MHNAHGVVFDNGCIRIKSNYLNFCVIYNYLFLLYNVFIFHLSRIMENKNIPNKIGNATSDTIKMKA